MNKCKIIAIANQKGGVGKTTTTVNLGIGLAALGKRVLLVDGDPQGSLTIALGVPNPDTLVETISSAILAEISDQDIPVDYGILHHSEGVDLLPANIELSGVELPLYTAISRETVMRNILYRLRPQYDYILIDCMPSLGLMTINALAAADAVIIPSQPNYLSTKGLNLLLRSISKVKKQINPKLTITGILFTIVDNRTNNARSIISAMRTTVGDQIRVFGTEIPRSIRTVEAAESGQSIFTYDPHGKAAKAYAELTKEVSKIDKTKDRSRFDSVR